MPFKDSKEAASWLDARKHWSDECEKELQEKGVDLESSGYAIVESGKIDVRYYDENLSETVTLKLYVTPWEESKYFIDVEEY